MNVIQNFQKFRVRVGCLTELAEALCRVIPGVKTPGTVCKYPKKHNIGKKNGLLLRTCISVSSQIDASIHSSI